MKKFFLVSVLGFSLLLTACGGPVDDSQTIKVNTPGDEVIKIGFINPLTGNAAAYGSDGRRAVELFFSQNPEINGQKVEVIYEDGKCNGQEAASAATKLVNVDGVKAIIGGACSGETLGAAPVAEQNKVILLSTVSSSPEVTDAGDYVFRVYPSDAVVGQTLAKEALQFEKIAMLVESTDYAEAYRNSVKAELEANGVTLVVDEVYLPDTTDFKTVLQKVKDAEADVLLSISQSAVTNGFIAKQVRELGIELQLFGTDTMEGQDFFDVAKDATEGAKMVVVADDPSREGVQTFLDELGTVESANILAIKAYDAADVLFQAIAAVGYDAEKIKQWLYDMPAYEGLGGTIAFDENGDNPTQGGSVKMVVDGAFVLQK